MCAASAPTRVLPLALRDELADVMYEFGPRLHSSEPGGARTGEVVDYVLALHAAGVATKMCTDRLTMAPGAERLVVEQSPTFRPERLAPRGRFMAAPDGTPSGAARLRATSRLRSVRSDGPRRHLHADARGYTRLFTRPLANRLRADDPATGSRRRPWTGNSTPASKASRRVPTFGSRGRDRSWWLPQVPLRPAGAATPKRPVIFECVGVPGIWHHRQRTAVLARVGVHGLRPQPFMASTKRSILWPVLGTPLGVPRHVQVLASTVNASCHHRDAGVFDACSHAKSAIDPNAASPPTIPRSE